MTKISLDIKPGGEPPIDDHCADVRGPGAASVLELMMRRKFIGQASTKIVRLADIYRIPTSVASQANKHVYTGNGVKLDADCVVLEFIPRAADAGPDQSI